MVLLNALPSFALNVTGSFLCSGDTIKCYRTCKQNDRLQSIMASISKATVGPMMGRDHPVASEICKAHVSILLDCPRLECLAVRFCPAAQLRTLLSSSHIKSSLRILKLRQFGDYEELSQVLKLLPELKCLENVYLMCTHQDLVELGYFPDLESSEWQELLSNLPQRTKALTFGHVYPTQLNALSNLIIQNRLPVLKELSLPFCLVESLADVDLFRAALGGLSGKKMKKLSIGMDWRAFHEEDAWRLISHILGLDAVHEPEHEPFPELECLFLNPMNWYQMGKCLIDGKFSRLLQVGTVDSLWWREEPINATYEIMGHGRFYGRSGPFCECTEATSKLWFEQVLPRRPHIRPFTDKGLIVDDFQLDLHYTFEENLESGLEYAKLVMPLLVAIPQPFGRTMASAISYLDISGTSMDEVMCTALVESFNSKNLVSLDYLDFSLLIEVAALGGLVNIGRVLHQETLPSLTSLSLRILNTNRTTHLFPSLEGKWQAFEEACQAFIEVIPQYGLSKLKTLSLGHLSPYKSVVLSPIVPMCMALAGQQSASAVFSNVECLVFMGECHSQELLGIAAAVSAGVFPRLTHLQLEGLSSLLNLEGVSDMFLHRLSRYQPLRGITFTDWIPIDSRRGCDFTLNVLDLAARFLSKHPSLFPNKEFVNFVNAYLPYEEATIILKRYPKAISQIFKLR